jgi:DNA polymerase III delta prime subunit
MFENIIGQENVIKLLKNDFLRKSFNNSMIFYGEKYTGKLSTALELTRILNCKNKADSECLCSNCSRIKSLDFEGMIFLSRRNFYFYLFEYINSYKTSKEKKYINLIKKTIKLSLLPLQDFLVKETLGKTEKKYISDKAVFLSDMIFKNEFTSVDLEEILEVSKEINSFYKKPNIPIDSIRGMLDWTYIYHPDINRVVIIDQADFLEDSSRNILLKRLEEPSPNLYFILIAESKNRIIETIRSRCRTYYFKKLTTDKVLTILYENWGEKNIHNSIEDFLLRSDVTSHSNVYPIIIKLLNYVFIKEHSFSELNVFIQGLNDRRLVKSLLLNLTIIFEDELKLREINRNIAPELNFLRKLSFMDLENINILLKEKYKIIDKFSLNPVLLLEGIFYPIKVMAQNDKI